MKQRRAETPRQLLMTLAFCLGTTGPVFAGIADSPLPVLLAGKTTHPVWSVPGTIETGTLRTFFSCTSTDTTPMQVGVEVFPPGGFAACNDAAATSLTLAPGATRIFGTSSAVGILIDSNVGGCLTSKGSARIVATSKKLLCTAFVADIGNDPPTTSWQLTIVKQKKQKGD
jgi:hypothetical protein